MELLALERMYARYCFRSSHAEGQAILLFLMAHHKCEMLMEVV